MFVEVISTSYYIRVYSWMWIHFSFFFFSSNIFFTHDVDVGSVFIFFVVVFLPDIYTHTHFLSPNWLKICDYFVENFHWFFFFFSNIAFVFSSLALKFCFNILARLRFAVSQLLAPIKVKQSLRNSSLWVASSTMLKFSTIFFECNSSLLFGLEFFGSLAACFGWGFLTDFFVADFLIAGFFCTGFAGSFFPFFTSRVTLKCFNKIVTKCFQLFYTYLTTIIIN